MAIKRQTIIDNLKAKLETIKISNGYHTDIGTRVYAFKSSKWAAEQIPGIDVRDIKDVLGTWQTEDHLHHLKIEIEFIVASGSTSASDIRKIIADIYKALGSDTTLSGAADDIQIGEDGGDEIHIEQEDLSIGGGVIRMEILFHTTRFQES